MLLLVLADNLVFLYAGWELVGACSYLLIGFWFERPSAATAAKKAFITTRIGDTGMLIGIFVVVRGRRVAADRRHQPRGGRGRHRPLDGDDRRAAALRRRGREVGAAPALRLAPRRDGGPDAGVGPHPRGDDGHGRCLPRRPAEPALRVRGGRRDGRRGRSASRRRSTRRSSRWPRTTSSASSRTRRSASSASCSSPPASGPTGAAIFHLVTHAFFKALLFLAAGSVMHALGGETALDRMGGLRKAIPRTFAVMLVGWGAITGVVPFAGLLLEGRDHGRRVGGGTHRRSSSSPRLAATCTAFYMSRMMILAFFGKPRWSEGTHPHESPPVMIRADGGPRRRGRHRRRAQPARRRSRGGGMLERLPRAGDRHTQPHEEADRRRSS